MPDNVDLTRLITAEAKAAADLAQARQAAKLGRLQFAMALRAGGVVTKAEAAAWLANGTLPAIGAAALAQIADDAAREDAELRFIAATEIERLNPFIALLQVEAGLTDAQVDALFGIA